MNKKQTIRLNENQLKRIVSESVKKVLNETNYPTKTRLKVRDDATLIAILDREDGRVDFSLIDSEGFPYIGMEWWAGVELYNDGTWMPFDGVFKGNSKIPGWLRPYILKALKKIGMTSDND